MKKYWKVLLVTLCMVFALSMAGFVAACGEDNSAPVDGTITGVTVDKDGEAIEEVAVYYGEDAMVLSDSEGKFTITGIKADEITLKTEATGYAVTERKVEKAEFNKEGVADVKLVLQEGKGTIRGTVSMSGFTTKKLAGVTIRIAGTALTATTDAKGVYEIKDVPMLGSKPLTASLTGYADKTSTIRTTNFKNGVADVNFQLEQNDLAELPGIKPYQLETMTALDANLTNIKSGDISRYFTASRDGIEGSSKVEPHSEGFCVNANTTEARSNMVAFIFAKVKVDDAHKFLTAHARVFFGQNGGASREDELAGNFTNSSLAELGLFAFDEDGKFINDSRFGAFTKINSEAFIPVTFDLSSMSGKTITIVLGTKTGYHCCLDRLEFTSAEPTYMVVKGVDGLGQLLITGKTTKTEFDAAALTSDWATGGGTTKGDSGITLNGTDPWKAVHFDKNNPQPVNSYMHITTDISAEKSMLTIDTTILNLKDCLDPGNQQDQGPYYPYVTVIVLKADGTKLKMFDWQSPWKELADAGTEVTDENKDRQLKFDLSDCVGEDVTVVIAANVGYRATVTNVAFGAKA